jgi:hypothetical protein
MATYRNKKYLHYLVIGLFLCTLLILFIRSAVYLKRTIVEVHLFSVNKKVDLFLPNIKACSGEKNTYSAEEKQLLYYRAFGTQCKK